MFKKAFSIFLINLLFSSACYCAQEIRPENLEEHKIQYDELEEELESIINTL